MNEARLYPARPFLAASVAVIRDGRLLVAARGRPPLAGIFSLPGGLVEPGETLAEAALRELREETGVAADMIGFVAPVEFIDRDGEGRIRSHFVIAAHLAHWRAGEPATGAEASAFRWLGPDELEAVPTTPGLVPVLAAAFALWARYRENAGIPAGAH